LAFEFHAYFQSKPEHWNREQLMARQPGSFHYQNWAAGQIQQVQARERLADSPDFSQMDCIACHHALSGEQNPIAGAQILKASAWPRVPLPTSAVTQPIADRLALATALLRADGKRLRWDDSWQTYLAVRAIMADITERTLPRSAAEIAATNQSLKQLGSYLATDCFARGHQTASASGYDSPAYFMPAKAQERMAAVSKAIERLQTTLNAP
jgi:hypothetical protein